MEKEDLTESAPKTKKKNPLLVIFLTVFIDLLGFSIVIPILAPLLALPQGSSILPNTPFDQRLVIFGFLIGSYALAQFIATPIIGQLSDRYGRKKLLAISLLGTLVSRIIFIIGIVNGNIVLLFISRIVDGITGGNISVAQSAIADISTPANRAKNFGLIGAAFGLGFILGPTLGGKLGDPALVASVATVLPSWIASSSTLPLWVATILCAANIILLYFIFPETIKERVTHPFKLNSAFTNTIKALKVDSIRSVLITIFLFTFGFSFFTQFLSVYVQDKFSAQIQQQTEDQLSSGKVKITVPVEISQIPVPAVRAKAEADFTAKVKEGLTAANAQTTSADLFTFIGICSVFAQLVVLRWAAKRFKTERLYQFGLITNAIVALLFLIPTRLEYLYLIMPFFAMSNGLVQPNSQALISNAADAKSQGEALGGSQSVAALAQALPPIIAGYVATINTNLPVILASGTVFLAFLFFSIFYFRGNKQEIFHEE